MLEMPDSIEKLQLLRRAYYEDLSDALSPMVRAEIARLEKMFPRAPSVDQLLDSISELVAVLERDDIDEGMRISAINHAKYLLDSSRDHSGKKK